MRHLLQLLTSQVMMMTTDAHQSYYHALLDYYKHPTQFLAEGAVGARSRDDTLCHLAVFGPTTHRFRGVDANCDVIRCYRDIRVDLAEAVADEAITHILIEFDGPGGEGSGLFDLLDYMSEVKQSKPIIGFINGASFSANYAIASQCTELYMTPHSVGGSIGAIYCREERCESETKVHYITSGEAKADGQPYLSMTESELKRWQTLITETAHTFFERVADARHLKPEDVEALQANIFSADKMLELGLIDGIKTEEEIKMMMSTAKHQRIVAELHAEHEQDMQALHHTNQQLSQQIEQIQADAKALGDNQLRLLKQVDQLAESAGVRDIAAELVVQGADLVTAKEKIKTEAAKRDQTLSLSSNLEEQDNTFDMTQLIKEA
ncbi:hypothetical protein C9980_25180 [Vibrio mediterranei]|nr:hypothetical protein C9980_25180 [Vibrio mediterranei]